jgi:hypothetical protein
LPTYFCILKGSGGGSAKAGGKKKKADDTIQKAKAVIPNFVIPEYAYSLKALSIILNIILM